MKHFDIINETDANGHNGLHRIKDNMFLCWIETKESHREVQTFIGLTRSELQELKLWCSDRKEGILLTNARTQTVHFKKV